MPVYINQPVQFINPPRVEQFYDQTTPSLNVVASPTGFQIDTSELTKWEQKQKDRAAFWQSFAKATDTGMNILKTAKQEAAEKGALAAIKGEEIEPLTLRNFMTYNTFKDSYAKTKASLALNRYQAEANLFYIQNKDKYEKPEDLDKAFQEYMNTWLEAHRNEFPISAEEFQKTFMPGAIDVHTQIATNWLNEEYNQIAQELADAAFTQVKQESEDIILNSLEKMGVGDLQELASLSQSALVNPEVLKTPWNDITKTQTALRQHLSELQKQSKNYGMTRDEVASVFLDEVGQIAITYGIPELLDFTEIKDESGIKLSNTKLADKIEQYKQLATQVRQQQQEEWQAYEEKWAEQADTTYKNSWRYRLGLLQLRLNDDDITVRKNAKKEALALYAQLREDPKFLGLDDDTFVNKTLTDLINIANEEVVFPETTHPEAIEALASLGQNLTIQDVLTQFDLGRLSEADYKKYMEKASANEERQRSEQLNKDEVILINKITGDEIVTDEELALAREKLGPDALEQVYKVYNQSIKNKNYNEFKKRIRNIILKNEGKIDEQTWNYLHEQLGDWFPEGSDKYEEAEKWLQDIQKDTNKALEIAKTESQIDKAWEIEVSIRSASGTYSDLFMTIVNEADKGTITEAQAGKLMTLLDQKLKPKEPEILSRDSIKFARENIEGSIKNWSKDPITKLLDPAVSAKYSQWLNVFEESFLQTHSPEELNKLTDKELHDLYNEEVIKPLLEIHKQQEEFAEIPELKLGSYEDLMFQAEQYKKAVNNAEQERLKYVQKFAFDSVENLVTQGQTDGALSAFDIPAIDSAVMSLTGDPLTATEVVNEAITNEVIKTIEEQKIPPEQALPRIYAWLEAVGITGDRFMNVARKIWDKLTGGEKEKEETQILFNPENFDNFTKGLESMGYRIVKEEPQPEADVSNEDLYFPNENTEKPLTENYLEDIKQEKREVPTELQMPEGLPKEVSTELQTSEELPSEEVLKDKVNNFFKSYLPSENQEIVASDNFNSIKDTLQKSEIPVDTILALGLVEGRWGSKEAQGNIFQVKNAVDDFNKATGKNYDKNKLTPEQSAEVMLYYLGNEIPSQYADKFADASEKEKEHISKLLKINKKDLTYEALLNKFKEAIRQPLKRDNLLQLLILAGYNEGTNTIAEKIKAGEDWTTVMHADSDKDSALDYAMKIIKYVDPAKNEYIVKRGDTLWTLAKKFFPEEFKQDPNKAIQKLKKLNNLKSDDIKVGQILFIAPVEGK